MSYRTRILAASLAIIASIYGCASSSSVPEAAGRADGNSKSRMSDLAVAPATRRLHSSKDWIDDELRPSPDGRYVSMTDWSTGDLALHDLIKDSTLRLTRKGPWNISDDFAETSVISPDGKSVAYGWYTESRLSYGIKVMSLSGADSGKTRTILEGGPMGYTAAQAWTPDGRNVVVVVGVAQGSTTYIAVVPVNGGAAKHIKTFKSGSPNDIAVSPDGKWLAYDTETDQATGDRGIFLLSLDGTSESIISREKGDEFVVGWSRDGLRILYGSERGGTTGVWAIAVPGGQPSGAPVLVRSDVARMYPLGTTKAGGILYGVATGTKNVFVASMDATTGELSSRPTAINVPPSASGFSLALSPDGRHLASVVSRGSRSGVGAPDIWIHSIERGEVRRISPKMRRIWYLNWAPDGSSLIARGTDMKDMRGIYAIDLKSAKMRTIAQSTEPTGFGGILSLTTTGNIGYFTSTDSAYRKFSVTRIDLETGRRQVVFETPQLIRGMAVSPDGSQLGIGIGGGAYGNGVIALLPVTGGVLREIFRFGDSETIPMMSFNIFAWSGSGKDIVFAVTPASDSSNARADLRALSVADGKLRSLHIPAGKITSLRISPDSRRIAYFVSDYSSELWMMDEPVFGASRSAAVHK